MTDLKPLTSLMLNDDAYVLGFIAVAAGHNGREDVGDSIDRGLILARLMREFGYGIVKLPEGRLPGLRMDQIDIPIADHFMPRMAYAVHYNEKAREVLIEKGWTPPPT